MPSKHAKHFQEDFEKELLEATRQNNLLTVDEALKQVHTKMLANNPFVPPTGSHCPINHLPNELLAHIFFLGTYVEDEFEEDDDDSYSGDSDDDETSDGHDLAQGWESASEGENDDVAVDDQSKVVDPDVEDVDMEGSESSSSSHRSSSATEVEPDFPVLVSHVCRHWREVALSTPSLWTDINFDYEKPPFERCRIWIERSGGLPLNICLDLTLPGENHDLEEEQDASTSSTINHDSIILSTAGNITIFNTVFGTLPPEDDLDSENSSWILYYSDDDVNAMLDIICPHSERWQKLDVSVTAYKHMHRILSRLEGLPPAPLLEVLDLRHCSEEDLDPDATFHPSSLRLPFFRPFQGQAPQLRRISLWGVHIAWEETNIVNHDSSSQINPPILFHSATQLSDFELAFHTSDVRPSYTAFASILQSSSHLTRLTLSASGPAGPPSDWFLSGAQSLPKLSVPQLRSLDLRYHEPEYAIGLVQVLDVPSLRELTLDYDSEDYTDFVKALAGETLNDRTSLVSKPKKGSLLNGLEYLKISSLPCDKVRVELLLGELGNLQHLFLKCVSEEVTEIYRRLQKPINLSNPHLLYCPSLKILSTTDIKGEEMRDMVKAREAAALPLRKVCLSEKDDVTRSDAKWLGEHLIEGVEYFEDSDSDDEFDNASMYSDEVEEGF